jgi:SlyX protein
LERGMTTPNERIMKLEETIAHLGMANDELSAEVLAQWKHIEALERKLAQFENRFLALEEASENPVENTKPPHY